jgi:hypothetical protein
LGTSEKRITGEALMTHASVFTPRFLQRLLEAGLNHRNAPARQLVDERRERQAGD